MLIAAGAILAFAVEYTVSGIDIQVIGAILMVVGIIGLAVSLLFWTSFSPFARTRDGSADTVTEVTHRVP